jgi:hypothetical protein
MLGLARGAGLFTLLACLGLPLLAWGGWVFEPAWTALLLAGWTAYTLARHYGLALACYRRLLALETVLVVLLVAGLGLFGDGRPWLAYAALAVPTALWAVALALLALRAAAAALPAGGACAPPASRAALNFVSGGMSMVLVPCTVQVAGEAYGGLVALIGSLTSVLLLFPRALSFNALPALARVVHHQGVGEVRACWAACAATCCGEQRPQPARRGGLGRAGVAGAAGRLCAGRRERDLPAAAGELLRGPAGAARSQLPADRRGDAPAAAGECPVADPVRARLRG